MLLRSIPNLKVTKQVRHHIPLTTQNVFRYGKHSQGAIKVERPQSFSTHPHLLKPDLKGPLLTNRQLFHSSTLSLAGTDKHSGDHQVGGKTFSVSLMPDQYRTDESTELFCAVRELLKEAFDSDTMSVGYNTRRAATNAVKDIKGTDLLLLYHSDYASLDECFSPSSIQSKQSPPLIAAVLLEKPKAGKLVELHMGTVSETYRNRTSDNSGYGKRMMAAAFRHCLQHNTKQLTSWVDRTNTDCIYMSYAVGGYCIDLATNQRMSLEEFKQKEEKFTPLMKLAPHPGYQVYFDLESPEVQSFLPEESTID